MRVTRKQISRSLGQKLETPFRIGVTTLRHLHQWRCLPSVVAVPPLLTNVPSLCLLRGTLFGLLAESVPPFGSHFSLLLSGSRAPRGAEASEQRRGALTGVPAGPGVPRSQGGLAASTALQL